MSAECPACVHDQLRTAVDDALAKLDEWLASPYADMDLEDKAQVQKLRDAVFCSQQVIRVSWKRG